MTVTNTASIASVPIKSTIPSVNFLEKLQETAFQTYGSSNFDPKCYVDLSLKFDLKATEKAFDEIPRSQNGSILSKDFKTFVERYFYGAGEDLIFVEPVDFVVEPDGFLPKVNNQKVRNWALEVHSLWRNLSRRVSDGVKEHPELHTLLALPGTSVVPGVEDKESASKLLTNAEKQQFYHEVASNAESGWDFSTRWMRNASDLTTLDTTSILPVDLNAYILKVQPKIRENAKEHKFGTISQKSIHVLFWEVRKCRIKMELDIAYLAKVLGESSVARHFNEASQARKNAIQTIFWNEKMGQCLDYWLGTTGKDVHKWEARSQNQNIFASNFIPLWIELFNSDEYVVDKVVISLKKSGLLHAAAVASSLTNSTEQWSGKVRSESKEAKTSAKDIAVRWIKTNYATYMKTGKMHEKYDVQRCGEFGDGGEYVPQTGFGWTNVVVLALLEEFGWPEDQDIESLTCSEN
ncbi:Glycoside hydrolase, family 37 [Dillenia turbinata]|uniref:Trehalase n=1 Tax=Dillenia turbinata TaxID=194707 RepID=A0AAN8VWS8_9MAGN